MNLFTIIFTIGIGQCFAANQCLFYRVRSEEEINETNAVSRNCSTSSGSWCVKILSRNEVSQHDTVQSITSIEGRCSFSDDECKGNEQKCRTELPTERFGIAVHEYKCCSSEDLSNGVYFAIPVLPFLLISIIKL